MRVVWVTNDLPPRPGGIEQFVGNLLTRVESASTVVVGPARPGAAAHDRDAPYRVVRAAGGVWPTPSTLALVRAVARAHRPDVVVLGAAWPLGELAPALSRDAPVVAISHGLEAGIAGVGLGRLVGRATRGCAAVTTISGFTEGRLRPHVRAPRLVRVPPGVDVEVFRPGRDGAELRRRWGVPADAALVGAISRLVPRKGQDTLLAAWPAVADRHPDAWLVLVGEGPLDADLRRRATTLARTVVAGPVAWQDLAAAHAALDVLAVPCRTRLLGTDVEGLGIVYLEAQACGVPVVAGRSGGAPEAVRDGESGIVVDGRDPGEVAAAVDALLADPQRRAAMGRAGRAWVERCWSWETVARRFRELLEEVTAERR